MCAGLELSLENAYLVHLIRVHFFKWILLKQIFDNKYIFCCVYLFPMFWFLIRQSFLQVPLINSEVLHPAVWNHTNIRFLNWHLWSISTNIKCRIYIFMICVFKLYVNSIFYSYYVLILLLKIAEDYVFVLHYTSPNNH